MIARHYILNLSTIQDSSDDDVSYAIENSSSELELRSPISDESADDQFLLNFNQLGEENDGFIFSDDAYVNDEDTIKEAIPTTTMGDMAYKVEEKISKGKYVNGHVILDQYGLLLSGQDHSIEGYRYQKYFLQRIGSTSFGTSIPLLYQETMLARWIHEWCKTIPFMVFNH